MVPWVQDPVKTHFQKVGGGTVFSCVFKKRAITPFLGLPLLPPPHPCRTHDNMHLVHVLLCVVFTTTHSISHHSRIHRTNKITSITTSANQWVATKLVTTNEPREGTTDTTKQSISVLYHEQHYHIVEGATTSPEELHKLVATGSYTDSIGSAGWGALELTTYPNHEDERQMYAAGLAEGYLTNTRIRQLYINDVSLRTDQSLTGLYRYFEIQDRYLRSYAKGGSNHVKGSLFWKHVALEMAQLDGLTDGYNYGADEPNQLVLGDLWLLNMDGDVIDLERGVTQGLVDITENIKEPVVLADLVGGSLRGNANDPPSLLETKTTTTTVDTSSSAVGASSTPQTSFPLPSSSASSLTSSSTSSFSVPPSTAPTVVERTFTRYSQQHWDHLMRHGRCSCLIKVLPDYSDVFVGHATWADYSELLRIWKTYTFPLSDAAAKQMSFSSYAGMISSTDDWYVTDQQLLITETTTQVEDVSTLKEIDPHTQIVSWVRTMVANRLSTNGPEWSKNYVQGNSGTYNCQWMVLDYKMFEKNKKPLPNFFTMTEIIPGMYHYEDMTSTILLRGEKKCTLKAGEDAQSATHLQCLQDHMYWPSINRPYWSDIRQRAGYPVEDPSAVNNEFFSFENNPRGNVFARDQSHIKTIQDMMQMMAYNDPLDTVQQDPGHGIASRYDLPGSDSSDDELRPSGALDFKVSNSNMVKQLMTVAQIGPTHETHLPSWRITELGKQAESRETINKPFRWDDQPSFANVPHYGIPMELNFDWQIVGPGKLDLPQNKESVGDYLKGV